MRNKEAVKLLDEMIESPANSKIESCILWVYDDAFAKGYGSAIVNDAASALAEGASEELARLRAIEAEAEKIVTLRRTRIKPNQWNSWNDEILRAVNALDAALKGGNE